MIGVVIPTKDEAATLGACLASVARAACHPALGGENVAVVVVLDSCTDESWLIARDHRVMVLPVGFSNVGAARAHGATALLARGARWLACTDADSTVREDWLVEQLGADADVVCGTVHVDDWSAHATEVADRYRAGYRDQDGHRHIHGANLGISRSAYRAVGGFSPLTAHEDVALVRAASDAGFAVAYSARPRVVTSARLTARAPQGFAAHLRGLHDRLHDE